MILNLFPSVRQYTPLLLVTIKHSMLRHSFVFLATSVKLPHNHLFGGQILLSTKQIITFAQIVNLFAANHNIILLVRVKLILVILLEWHSQLNLQQSFFSPFLATVVIHVSVLFKKNKYLRYSVS